MGNLAKGVPAGSGAPGPPNFAKMFKKAKFQIFCKKHNIQTSKFFIFSSTYRSRVPFSHFPTLPGPVPATLPATANHRGEPSGLELLRDFRPVLAALDEPTPDAIEDAAGRFAEERGLGLGRIAQPLRVALTGGTASPALGETVALVGLPGALARIDRCLEECAPA